MYPSSQPRSSIQLVSALYPTPNAASPPYTAAALLKICLLLSVFMGSMFPVLSCYQCGVLARPVNHPSAHGRYPRPLPPFEWGDAYEDVAPLSGNRRRKTDAGGFTAKAGIG